MSVVINGTGSISGLSNVGGIASAQSGSIIQTVQGTLSSSFSTTSTSYVTTGLTASITPQFSTSKILVIANGCTYYSGGTGASYWTLYRNSTNLEITSGRGFLELNIPTSNTGQTIGISYLDSPATTSSTSYTVYARTPSANSITLATDGSTATITLLEIAQ